MGTPYFYKVRANNTYGESALSNEANATATAITAPGAPQNLVATPGKGKVTLTWHAPSDDGGSAITGYQIFRAIEGGSAALWDTISAIFLVEDDLPGRHQLHLHGEGGQRHRSWISILPVTTSPQEDSGDGGSDNTMLYIGAAVVGVAAIGGIAYFLMRKKK